MLKKVVALVSVPLMALSLSACQGTGGGASKAEVVKGMSQGISESLEGMGIVDLKSESVNKYVECIVDEAYESLSASSRKLLADGKLTDISDEDAKAITDATQGCQETLVDEVLK